MSRKTSGVVAVIVGVFTASVPTFLLYQAVTFLFVIPLILGVLCILLGLVALRTDSSISRHAGWLALVILCIAVGVPFGLIAYHSRSGHPIVLVMPTDY